MLALLRAQLRYNAEPHLREIKAKVLYVLVSSDRLYPPTLAPGLMAKLEAAGVDATYFLVDSPYGHSATTPDAAKWAVLAAFIDRIACLRRGSLDSASIDCRFAVLSHTQHGIVPPCIDKRPA